MADCSSHQADSAATSWPSVAVIIAAYNVAETIGQAVQSALAQPETTEVVVVDDASTDDTAHIACEAADNDPRLLVIRNEKNLGPARSRNVAISSSTAPYIAILDGDDFYLPGRFTQMFAQPAWDLCADNIIFFTEQNQIEPVRSCFEAGNLQSITLDLKSFISGNIHTGGQSRGELGFLKPAMRRAFLEKHKLAYTEDCRLGEDFLFYVEALAKGARYTVLSRCGYAALVRENSLSGQHSLQDLSALHRGELELINRLTLGREEHALLTKRARSTLRKVHHREVLASKAEGGRLKGVVTGLRRPTSFIDIARDRMRQIGRGNKSVAPRTLLHQGFFILDQC
jgi:succinoglycan biosynthesis protein ExoU